MECGRGLAMRILSVCLSVCPFVCPSNARIVTKRKKDLSRYLYHTKDLKRTMVGGRDTFYLKFWVNRPCWSEIADFQPIFARTASAVTPSEKKFN